MLCSPSFKDLAPDWHGVKFCFVAAKEIRRSKSDSEFIWLKLQDRTATLRANIFDNVERLKSEFETGDFVKVQARADLYNGGLQLKVEKIRRVNPDQDRLEGFRVEDCVPCSPYDLGEMWEEINRLARTVPANPFVGDLLARVLDKYADRIRVWPAAKSVHHAYRGGFLEHVLSVARVALLLADAYGADRDIVLAGALLHDIGKLHELDVEPAPAYTREGNLVGHIALGVVLVREVAATIPGFPVELRTQIEHTVVSHHGSLEFGSPVLPKTIEAFIVAMADDLDAKIHQIRRAMDEDTAEGEFTAHHRRLDRVLFKGGAR